MKKITLKFGVLFILCLLQGLGLAAPTDIGNDRLTAGVRAQDATIELDATLRLSKALGGLAHVDVKSFNRQVLLIGAVADVASKEMAEQAVARVQNVRSVVNQLVVAGPMSLAERSSDQFLVGRVKAQLIDADLPVLAFQVTAYRGAVYLMGFVSMREAERATDEVRRMRGVTRVIRLFEIRSDAEIASLSARDPRSDLEARRQQQQLEQSAASEARERERRAIEGEAVRRRQQELAALAAAAAAPAPSPTPAVQYVQRRALVIGNDNYQSVKRLRNAVADARAIAASLQRAGYQVSLHLDVGEKRFKQALRDFRYEVQGGDEVMFFFAGHGVEIAGANYLVPVDARVSGNFDERDRDKLREESVDLKRFMSELAGRKTKFALAVIDACREDPFPTAPADRSIATRAGLVQTTPATGQMLIFSAGAGQVALDTLGERDPSRNGVFTRVFLAEMDKPGVPIDRVLKNVRTQVSRLARSVDRTQTPAIYDESEGDFYFRLP